MAERNKIVCTGSEGFIGKHLVKRLKELGHYVIGIDLKLYKNSDITKLTAKDFEGFDYVFHCAAQAKVQVSIESPAWTTFHNVFGTAMVLSAAQKAGVKRVIYSASSSAYGEQKSSPLKEDMIPNPMNPYAVQKLCGELLMKTFSDVYGLDTVCLRYFNVYGEDMPSDSAYSACIATFLKQKRDNVPLTVFGGLQRRDFTYVGDVVEANIRAMNSDKIFKGEVINIGSGKNYSIDEIAAAISNNTEHSEQRKNEAMESLADITKAKEWLLWEPTTDVLQWLKKQS